MGAIDENDNEANERVSIQGETKFCGGPVETVISESCDKVEDACPAVSKEHQSHHRKRKLLDTSIVTLRKRGRLRRRDSSRRRETPHNNEEVHRENSWLQASHALTEAEKDDRRDENVQPILPPTCDSNIILRLVSKLLLKKGNVVNMPISSFEKMQGERNKNKQVFPGNSKSECRTPTSSCTIEDAMKLSSSPRVLLESLAPHRIVHFNAAYQHLRHSKAPPTGVYSDLTAAIQDLFSDNLGLVIHRVRTSTQKNEVSHFLLEISLK